MRSSVLAVVGMLAVTAAMHSFRFRFTAALACIAVISGCTTNPAADDAPPGPTVPAVLITQSPGQPAAPSQSTTAASPSPAASGTDSTPPTSAMANALAPHIPPSPLDQYQVNDFEERARLVEHTLDDERETAECMRDRGWDYTPFVAVLPDIPSRTDLSDGSVGYFERYGYGVALNATPVLAGDLETYTEDIQATDPNAQYVAGLTDSERARYELDLHGQSNGETFAGGCVGSADLFADVPGRDEHFRFLAVVDGLRTNAAADPRAIAARDAWLDCLRRDVGALDIGDAQVREPADMFLYVLALLYIEGGQTVLSLEGVDPSNSLLGTLGGVDLRVEGEWLQPSPAAVVEFQARELELATADWACQQDARVIETRDEIENELVPALLEAFPDATRLDD